MKQVVVALLALHLAACSSASNSPAGDGGPGASGGAGGAGASGGSGGTGAIGGSGGGIPACGPGDADCICPGGTFECQANRLTCVCPPQCTRADQCGPDAMCFFLDGNCGGGAIGYCQSLAKASQWVCPQTPICGCDGNLYDNSCAAVAARVAPSAAPTSNCAARPLPCSDSPSAASCYPTPYFCTASSSGSLSEGCSRFDKFDLACPQPSCACIRYNQDLCRCELLPSGLVKLTCDI